MAIGIGEQNIKPIIFASMQPNLRKEGIAYCTCVFEITHTTEVHMQTRSKTVN